MSKAVFFDIDGTIWDQKQRIPESTVKAIRKLRENGHYAFLCSGRTRSFIRGENLFAIGFDGIVGGCGTYVEQEGKILRNIEIPDEKLGKAISLMKEYRLPFVMEGADYLYADAEDFVGDRFWGFLQHTMGEELLPVCGNEKNWHVNKFSINRGDQSLYEILGGMQNDFEIMLHQGEFTELVPKGNNKASGIAFVMEHLGIHREDTFAIGDSINDKDMIEFAGTGIVMGNGTEIVKQSADFITKDLQDDGLAYALKEFELI